MFNLTAYYFYSDEKGHPCAILGSDQLNDDETIMHSFSHGVGFAGLHLIGSGFSYSSVSVNHHSNGVQLVFASVDEIKNFIDRVVAVYNWKKNNVSQSSYFNGLW